MDIRKQLRTQRQQLSPAFRQTAAATITTKLINTKLFLCSQHIGIYLPSECEVDTLPLIKYIWEQNKSCYLPVLDRDKKTLNFIKHTTQDKLITINHGIPEPLFDQTKIINILNLDLVITPLVGFDELGQRLGRGQGYYDRTFACKKQLTSAAKPFLVGLAYELQKTTITPQPWDIPMTMVITEDSIYPNNLLNKCY